MKNRDPKSSSTIFQEPTLPNETSESFVKRYFVKT